VSAVQECDQYEVTYVLYATGRAAKKQPGTVAFLLPFSYFEALYVVSNSQPAILVTTSTTKREPRKGHEENNIIPMYAIPPREISANPLFTKMLKRASSIVTTTKRKQDTSPRISPFLNDA
jgi:hypothetical protein